MSDIKQLLADLVREMDKRSPDMRTFTVYKLNYGEATPPLPEAGFVFTMRPKKAPAGYKPRNGSESFSEPESD